MERLLSFCRQHDVWLLDTIKALVQTESPSTDKHAVDDCGAELRSRLTAIGGRVESIPRSEVGDIVRAEFGEGDRQVLLLGHFDTVWPVGHITRMPVVIRDGRLHGPGVFDMKAGIGLAALAVRALLETDGSPCRVLMLWTTDEEVGSRHSRALIEEEARKSEAVFVLEPSLPGGAVKTSRKGCGEFEVAVQGVAAHAGVDPGKGASAIHELAHQILAVEGLRDGRRGVSINVGRIDGGTRPNVVAESAHAIVDVRAETLEAARELEQAFRRLQPVNAATRLSVKGGFDRPPMERSAAVARLFEIAVGVARDLGHELAEGGTGGGSDGNFTAALGVPTLDGLGAIGEGAHALHEHIEIAELAWRAALIGGLIARVGTR
jgi:glutamate carboxypeptidase